MDSSEQPDLPVAAEHRQAVERDRLITNVMIGVTAAAGAAALAFAIHDIWFDDGDEEQDPGGGDVALGPGPGLGVSLEGAF